MGGKWKKWSKGDEKYLIENFNKVSISSFQRMFDCERKTILRKLIDLNLIKIKNDGKRYTITCKFCNKDFQVKKANRNREYCSKSCQSKSIIKNDSRLISECVECGKKFKHYGERVLCSVECNARYSSKMRLGENNPYFKNDKEKKQKCKNCKKVFIYTKNGKKKNYTPQYCSSKCWSLFQEGKNRELNGPALYDKQYSVKFKKIRNEIRQRDGNICSLCGCGPKHDRKIPVHHIDYNKNNNDKSNLITLCERCHGMTNVKCSRVFWELFFKGVMSGSKIVKKGWGVECHIANNKSYCLKYLIFFKDKKFSYHFHPLKKELWHCLIGKFKAKIDAGDEEREFLFKSGDKLHIEPNTIHQLTAIENSFIVEVSTTDYPEDSLKIVCGD